MLTDDFSLYLVIIVLAIQILTLFLLLSSRNHKDHQQLVEVLGEHQIGIEQVLKEQFREGRDDSSRLSRELRDEVGSRITSSGSGLSDILTKQIEALRASASESSRDLRGDVNSRLEEFRKALEALNESNGKRLTNVGTALTESAAKLQGSSETKLSEMRRTMDDKLTAMHEGNEQSGRQLRQDVSQNFTVFRQALDALKDGNEKRLQELQASLAKGVQELQASNAQKLEEMRKTVDEKLHGALEKRLGESFKQVSERLEAVHSGLGEMQTLANGVGDLKRLMSNVKTRGTWGEMQLGALLESFLAPDQFGANIETRPESGQRVEFAIRLPGQGTELQPVWLPIDAKFPQEDYQRLLDAEEQGEATQVERARRGVDRAVRQSAKDIAQKYIYPPRTTDFAILFVPIESLYAELLRQPGLTDALQRGKIILAGPTTLAALLNSLQMGFRTLAIQKRTSEVWEVLGAVKTEFGKFGDVLDKVRKKLNEATNVMDSADQRNRVMKRKLRDVEAMPDSQAAELLGLEEADSIADAASA